MLLILSGARTWEGSEAGPGCCASCSASLATQSSRSNGAEGSVAGRDAVQSLWQDFWISEQDPAIIKGEEKYSPFEK